MSARKLVYRLMVFAPALFLVGLGVNARTIIKTDFEFTTNDPHTERLIQAYVPYLRATAKVINSRHDPTRGELIQLGNLWVQGADRGELKPLTPIAYDDTSSDGAKSEIFDCGSKIVGKIINGIPASAAQGNLHLAASDAVLAIRMAAMLKYSDFVSLFNSATEQRRAIQQLAPIAAKLDPADREAVRKCLTWVDPCPKTVDMMMWRSKQLFLTWRTRRGFEPLSIEDTQLLSDVPAVIKNGSAVAMRELRDRIFASKDDHVPTFCSSLRLGISAQNLLDSDTRKLRALLK